ncbi:ionotropic receptor 25a-like [Photinus pyralis]|nr:ionotropic receptor 25a-like [Photinus pyralis]
MKVNVQTATAYPNSANATQQSLCKTYGQMLANKTEPHLLLDTTRSGMGSEMVKSFAAALELPTISASFGQEGDIRSWRRHSAAQHNYFVQVMPPGDLIPELIRTIVLQQNISNAAILFDNTFVMDHKYKSLLQNIATRHVMAFVNTTSTAHQLVTLRDLDIMNFFILGSLDTVALVLNTADDLDYFSRKFAWHIFTHESGEIKCKCRNGTIVHIRPLHVEPYRTRFNTLETTHNLNGKPQILAAFYFDLGLRSFMAVKDLLSSNHWPKNMSYVTCDEYDEKKKYPTRDPLLLRKSLSQVLGEELAYGPFRVIPNGGNGKNFMQFDMELRAITFKNGSAREPVYIGKWKASLEQQSNVDFADSENLVKYRADVIYRVFTIVQPPFVYINDSFARGYTGYCINLMDEIAKFLQFDYEIHIQKEGGFGQMDDHGNWDGIVHELLEKRADIALGSMAVMAERESVIDFTVPYYDLVGITILMKVPKQSTSLFKFLTVLEHEVWICILCAYFLTSLMLWIFDRFSPYSFQNNREKYRDHEEKREFHVKECLWFCMTSLTPQGGGESPKNLSGRLVAATWWLFGFIIIASYTANLAAFLTVSRLDIPVDSLDDLSKQYKIQYSPLNNSEQATYFKRMANIEKRFYEIWKDMSLNDSMSDAERSKLSVWEYPISDRYTKMWQTMQDSRLLKTLDEAVAKVRTSRTQNEGYAYIGDASDIKYLEMTACDLQKVGDEFSKKPYALAVQQGSPLKDQLNSAILNLLNMRQLERYKEYWWHENPFKVKCDKQEDQSDGISIQNIGGVFIVIFVGICLACGTLAFEYWYYKHRKVGNVIDTTVGSKDVYDMNGENVNKGIVKMPEKETNDVDDQRFKTLSVYPRARF